MWPFILLALFIFVVKLNENSQFCPVCKAPIDPDLVIPIFGRGADASSSPPNVSSSNPSFSEFTFAPTVTPDTLLDLNSRREAPPPPDTAGALRTIRVGCEALGGLEVDQEVERDRVGVQGESSRVKDGEKDGEKENSAEYDDTQTTSSSIAPLTTTSPEIQGTLLTSTSISLSTLPSPPTPSSSGPLPPEAESSQAPKPIPIRPIGARELLTSSSFQQWKVRSSPLPLPLSSLPSPPSARVVRSPSYRGSFFAASPRRPASSDHLPHLAHEADLIMFPASTHRRSVSSSFFSNYPMTNAADADDSASEIVIQRISSSPSPLPALAGEGSGEEEEGGRRGERRNDLMDTTLTTPSMTSSPAEATTPQMTRAFQREGRATAATGGICNDGGSGWKGDANDGNA
eukprot:CAMPEP_0175041754 /NCGR_PEP_ID=MMETSP0052_2-20121109/2121_1 /TAXON_ID=51329 ORGANISM="Polytomella parva, Strain SAG 63-3" /NCGR_SAMPLE_ID=MMETSP0052_2 /ASSEMBLY_ACC=CAM_ASM_000194 /LENGTH=401 /DNA_ID=CAMNT_0016304365 /DNA_START=291 /DNA_END=1496 /DNA_ORIENTATION=+